MVSNQPKGIEYTQLVIPQGVCIFKIPPVTQSKGFYLDDWKDMIWEGGVKVVDQDNQQFVQFISKDKSIFAVCNAYSSRGVGIRLSNPNGGFMWVGVAFRDRNDAFDFNVCTQEYQEKKQREIDPSILEKEFQPKQDFSLGQGQKLIITEHGAQLTNQNSGNIQNQSQSLSNFKFGNLNQPQSQNSSSFQSFQSNQETGSSKQSGNFTDFSGFNLNQNQMQSQKPTNQFSNFGDFIDFSSFSQQPPQQQNNQAKQKPQPNQTFDLLDM